MVRWLLIGVLAVQLLIVPWRGGRPPGAHPVFWSGPEISGYAPIFSPPGQGATIDAGRLLVQLAVTGGLLLLWLRVAKPEE
jgi:hypothetical protein